MNAILDQVAMTHKLLLVSDFDGTLAEFSTDPDNVPICTSSIKELQTLVNFPNTEVAILSGRSLASLRRVSGLDKPFVLAGSHGAESTLATYELTPEQTRALELATAEFERIAAAVPGAWVEHKPFHRVLHTIAIEDPDLAAATYRRAQEVVIPGVSIKAGKSIVEAGVLNSTKGTWITQAQHALNPTATVFIGDDTTDEEGFAVLGPADLSIKVGAGDTVARLRVDDVRAVSEVLAQIVEKRRAMQA